jgi:transcriptional regulator with XRE-family HTH domain
MSFPVDNIRRLCALHGTTLAKLERDLSIGNGVIARWENTKSSPPYDRLKQIADRFGVTVEQISEPTAQFGALHETTAAVGQIQNPASPQADGLIDKIIALAPESRALLARILAAAKEDPERVERYLAFLAQELESQR